MGRAAFPRIFRRQGYAVMPSVHVAIIEYSAAIIGLILLSAVAMSYDTKRIFTANPFPHGGFIYDEYASNRNRASHLPSRCDCFQPARGGGGRKRIHGGRHRGKSVFSDRRSYVRGHRRPYDDGNVAKVSRQERLHVRSRTREEMRRAFRL